MGKVSHQIRKTVETKNVDAFRFLIRLLGFIVIARHVQIDAEAMTGTQN